MSNCINIVFKNVVSLKPHEVDAQGLKELITRAEKEVNDKNCVDDNTSGELKVAWWHLSINTQFRKGGGVEVRLGNGRSSHTWRDFRGTLNVLKKFIKTPVWIRFGVTDEYDNHETIQRMTVNLQEGLK